MDDWIEITNNPEHKTREKERARRLRGSDWWKNHIEKGICYYCGRSFNPEEMTMDHIVPVARGGRSVKGNIVPSCKECNSKKKYYTPVELILKQIRENEI